MNQQLGEFYEHLNEAVITTNDFAEGTKFRKREKVANFAYAGLNPMYRQYLSFDLDAPQAAFLYEDQNLPPPTIITVNRENGHAHYLYLLKTPVAYHANSRDGPQKFFEAVQDAMTLRLNADPAFTHTLTKNPLHPRWHVLTHPVSYDLSDFTEYVDLKRRPPRPLPGHVLINGRNDHLFHTLRFWGYSAVHGHLREDAWHIAVLEQALEINAAFADPLPFQEVKATTKSVSRWVWSHRGNIGVPREKVMNFTDEPPKLRQKMAAVRTNQLRSANAIRKLKSTYDSLIAQGTPATPILLQAHSGLNIRTVRKYLPTVKSM
jgi:hypothetical protein